MGKKSTASEKVQIPELGLVCKLQIQEVEEVREENGQFIRKVTRNISLSHCESQDPVNIQIKPSALQEIQGGRLTLAPNELAVGRVRLSSTSEENVIDLQDARVLENAKLMSQVYQARDQTLKKMRQDLTNRNVPSDSPLFTKIAELEEDLRAGRESLFQ